MDIYEFMASLIYIVSFKTAMATHKQKKTIKIYYWKYCESQLHYSLNNRLLPTQLYNHTVHPDVPNKGIFFLSFPCFVLQLFFLIVFFTNSVQNAS